MNLWNLYTFYLLLFSVWSGSLCRYYCNSYLTNGEFIDGPLNLPCAVAVPVKSWELTYSLFSQLVAVLIAIKGFCCIAIEQGILCLFIFSYECCICLCLYNMDLLTSFVSLCSPSENLHICKLSNRLNKSKWQEMCPNALGCLLISENIEGNGPPSWYCVNLRQQMFCNLKVTSFQLQLPTWTPEAQVMFPFGALQALNVCQPLKPVFTFSHLVSLVSTRLDMMGNYNCCSCACPDHASSIIFFILDVKQPGKRNDGTKPSRGLGRGRWTAPLQSVGWDDCPKLISWLGQPWSF